MNLEKWNDRYRRGENVNQAPLPLIERVVRDFPPGVALDLACGPGRHAAYLAEHGWTVTALDASSVAIELLRSRGLNIDARVQDLEVADFQIAPGSFDLICDCYYLQRNLIPQIRAGVRPGGIVAIALPMFDDRPGLRPMNPEFLVRAGEVAGWFSDFTIEYYVEATEREDRRLAAQLIARRP